MSSEGISADQARRQQFLEELTQEVSDPLHCRLLLAYQGDSPVQAMEEELMKILLEVLHRED